MRRCLFAASLFCLVGCTAYQTLSLDQGYRADCFLSCKNHEGLYLSGESLFDTLKSEKYLFSDLKKDGFIPIVLYANNRGNNSYLLMAADVTLILPNGAELTPVPVDRVIQEVGASIEMRLDFGGKDFFRGRKGVRLSAKNDAVGAVFFRMPRDRGITGLTDAVLKLAMTREKGEGQADSKKVKVLVSLE